MMPANYWKLFVVLLALASGAVLAERREAAEPAQSEESEAHAEAKETPGVVTLDAEALERSGIAVSPVLLVRKVERQVAGVVLDRGALIELCRRYAAAGARAPELLSMIVQEARSRWGEGIVQALSGGSPMCAELSAATLIEATQPAAVAPPLPQTAWLERGRSASLPVERVSLVEKTHWPAQVHAFYLASGRADDLPPGQAVRLRVPAESKQSGAPARVPESAVVWLDGKPWVYVQEGTDRFVRRALAPQSIGPNERVVVTGAQMLLSQEFRSQIQVGEAGEHGEGEKSEQGEKK